MSARRLWIICRRELVATWRRPLLWIWLSLVAVLCLIAAAGILAINAGADQAGGVQAHITSQLGNAKELSLSVTFLFPLLVAVLAGMPILRDSELRLPPLLHSTPLRPGEYVWGCFLAALITSLSVLAVQLALSMLVKHTITASGRPELVGELSLSAYLLPALYFAVPLIVFVAGVCCAVGEGTRSPILVNMVPMVLMLASLFFLWTWAPSWLDWRWNRLLMLVDPTGFRWLNETWLKVDRGAGVYNTARLVLDPGFLLSRIALVGIGLAAVVRAQRHLGRVLRGTRVGAETARRALAAARDQVTRVLPLRSDLSSLGMSSLVPGLLAGLLEITGTEVRLLLRHPAIWVLIPLVVLNCTVDAIYAVGAFDAPLLLTPGISAVGSLDELTFTLLLLLMFYMVESLRRERATRIAAITSATPLRTSSLVLGKALACSAVGALTLLAVTATCAVLLLKQGVVPLDLTPYLVVYGLLLGPTVLAWCAYVGLLSALTGSRLATHALSVATMLVTPILLATKKLSWVWNWSLSNALSWSDLAPLEMSRTALLLNRLLVLSTAVLLLVLMIRVFPRRRFDTARILQRLQPEALCRLGLRLAPLLLIPLVLAISLHKGINRGLEGKRTERWAKHYWQRNHATWLDAPLPDLVHSDMELELEPERRWFATRGSFQLENGGDVALDRIPVTGGPHWQGLQWTLNGDAYQPEDRQGLYIFLLEEPLAPGERCSIGFQLEGVLPPGFSRNGQGSPELILPSGVVLTHTRPTFAPVLGYQESIGFSDDNRYDQKEYPPDFSQGRTPPLWGPDLPQTSRITITAPQRYTMNGVGVLTSSVIADGKRTVTWETDYPVDFINVVGGLWQVRRGNGTAIYHHPQHTYNLDEMIEALDGARRYYSEWFHPYPWQELKVSEFPGEIGYAQGFPTNITFSESMGFLAAPDPRVNAAFRVIAHEAAHQWWGGMVVPGRGPGGNILSEGMANFSTILLLDTVRGAGQRIELCKAIEDRYCSLRVVDSERAMVLTDGFRKGDLTVTYNKGGWVFWMLLQHMGRDANLAGLSSFIERYSGQRDHPVLQDLTAHLREHAPDVDAYDAFVEQWFHEVVLPHYTLHRVTCEHQADGSWWVSLEVRNAGTGRMPVEIAAERGTRFPELEPESTGEPFSEAGTSVELAAGESRQVTIRCDFEPQRVVVDPDATVLQQGRKHAIHRF